MRLLIFNVKEKERKLGLRSGHAYIFTIHVHTHPTMFLHVLALLCKRQCHFTPVKTELFRKSFQSENFHKLLHLYVDKEKLILVLLRSFCVFKNNRKKENSGLEKESRVRVEVAAVLCCSWLVGAGLSSCVQRH